MERARFPAMSLLGQSYLDMLGGGLKKVIPLRSNNDFTDVLRRLDQVERRRRR